MKWWPFLILIFINTICRLYAALPFGVRWALGSTLGVLTGRILRFRRYTVLKNARLVFPHFSHPEIYRFVNRTWPWLGYQVFESLRAPILDRYMSQIQIENLQYYLQVQQSSPSGVILLSCHVGNPDLGLTALALNKIPITLITKKFSLSWANELWQKLRCRHGLELIPAHGRETAFQIFKALGRKRAVVFVLDQFMGPPYGIQSRFFGHRTGTAYGIVKFVEKTKAPVVPVFTYQDHQGQIRVKFHPPILPQDLPASNSSEQALQQAVEIFNQAVEAMILEQPYQWMWIHRRWKRWQL